MIDQILSNGCNGQILGTERTRQDTAVPQRTFIGVSIRKVCNGYVVAENAECYPEPQWVYNTLAEAKNRAVAIIYGADI